MSSLSSVRYPVTSLPVVARVSITGFPDWVAVDDVNRSIWISNRDRNSVARGDVATNRLAAEVAVGRVPCSGLAVGHGSLWVPCCGEQEVFRVDLGFGEGVGFVDENHGWVGGWGDAQFQRLSTSQTIDGGQTWTDANEICKALNRFRFFGKPVTVGYASGQTVYKYSSDPIGPTPAQSTAGSRILTQAHPAVAGSSSTIALVVPHGAGKLAVRIWDRFGEHVITLVDETNPTPGARALVWDGKGATVWLSRPATSSSARPSIINPRAD
jgi:hypothetical protein